MHDIKQRVGFVGTRDTKGSRTRRFLPRRSLTRKEVAATPQFASSPMLRGIVLSEQLLVA
ncbi:hypothetical protein VSS74_01940 [Conexibacter stalactiti]|uniref:Uncharacterized protein n=1 Tax=Conexibacter stalactiti TaxID=1940611 RepID=A0ABU4HIE7_9ACTN|nr:hypothetical protein [Conexibacter stalactiti]MDW5593081.1 hypothetical protein [Conexibacter stalactiti]MEC5033722.1 hypothetical protein [Conexibacter stalactiti]